MIRKPGFSGPPRSASSTRREPGKREADDDGFETLGKPASRGPTLKARAVGYLSRREYARNELARKLQPYADDGTDIEAVLDTLEKEGWLSTERFAQSLVHRRAARQGTARIVQELRQHGVAEDQVAQLRDDLRATEYQRALDVWRKRYGAKPADRAEYARQARFLAGRGFAHDIIRRLLGQEHDD
ncbi:MAG TPA: recombination regulator RecX [Bordetella sp.]|nr:recombination regulator RecX [Bordetella sp.]